MTTSTERLHQLSRQITGLVAEVAAMLFSVVTEILHALLCIILYTCLHFSLHNLFVCLMSSLLHFCTLCHGSKFSAKNFYLLFLNLQTEVLW